MLPNYAYPSAVAGILCQPASFHMCSWSHYSLVHKNKAHQGLVTVAQPRLDDRRTEEGLIERSFFHNIPFLEHMTMVFPFWIHLRSRAEVGVQRRDFPTWKCWIIFWRSGIIQSERNYWKPRVYAGFAACFVARAFSLLSAPKQRKHKAKGWAPELATFLPFPPLCCYTLHHLNTRVYGGIRLIQTNLFARSVFFFLLRFP